MDYALFVNGKAVGSLEAKPEGETLRQVEPQAEHYADGFEETVKAKPYPRYFDRPPFHYISTGVETLFTSRRDPIRRPREVFHFHRPEALAAWAEQELTLRQKLRQMPPLNTEGLRDIQKHALRNLGASLADDKPKALLDITMGSGKTHIAVAESYRLLRFADAQRILYLVDRVSLGDQARDEFLSYVSPDDGRRFGDDYAVQVLRSNDIQKSANVVICTIQRLYSVLRGEKRGYDPDLDEEEHHGVLNSAKSTGTERVLTPGDEIQRTLLHERYGGRRVAPVEAHSREGRCARVPQVPAVHSPPWGSIPSTSTRACPSRTSRPSEKSSLTGSHSIVSGTRWSTRPT